jgi:hypothetical protein
MSLMSWSTSRNAALTTCRETRSPAVSARSERRLRLDELVTVAGIEWHRSCDDNSNLAHSARVPKLSIGRS